jgi:hypothetical protein
MITYVGIAIAALILLSGFFTRSTPAAQRTLSVPASPTQPLPRVPREDEEELDALRSFTNLQQIRRTLRERGIDAAKIAELLHPLLPFLLSEKPTQSQA